MPFGFSKFILEKKLMVKYSLNSGPAFANSPAKWTGSALLVIKYLNLYQQPGSSNLIGWKLEVGMVSLFIQHGKG